MSDTPRTDALEVKMYDEGLPRNFRAEYLFATFREWERELAEEQEKLDDATLQIGRLQGHKASLEAGSAALRKALERIVALLDETPGDNDSAVGECERIAIAALAGKQGTSDCGGFTPIAELVEGPCTRCNGTGWVTTHQDDIIGSDCPRCALQPGDSA